MDAETRARIHPAPPPDARRGPWGRLRRALRSRWSLWVLWPIYLISQGTIVYLLWDVDLDAFGQMQWTTSAKEMTDILQSFRDHGTMSDFLNHFWVDSFHPLWYTALLAAYTTQVLDSRGMPRVANVLYNLPIVAGLCDLMENGLHIYFAQDLSHITPRLATLAGSASMIKWGLVGIDILLLFALALKPLKEELEATLEGTP